MTAENKELQIEELLTRGVSEYVDPEGSFKKRLLEEPKSVVIKFGVDPTRPDIHLGHAVVLRKLRGFQDLGCKIAFLIGDFTARIGDPTGTSKVRPELEQAEIEANMKTYLDQVGKILSTDPTVFTWTRNSDWFLSMNDVEAAQQTTISIEANGKKVDLPQLEKNHFLVKAFIWNKTRMQKGNIVNYTFLNILSVLRAVTLSRLVERDMFQGRIARNEPVFMNEMLYPILQGIDSSAMARVFGTCDLEVGGSDQTFNMLMGRDVMKAAGQEPQAVLAFELLEGTDGAEKMSKSLDNYIAITDLPEDMYGKVMSIPDRLIVKYFRLCTYTPSKLIEEVEDALSHQKENPRDIKMRLAREITEMYHGREKALAAEESFIHTFQGRGIPEAIPEISVLTHSTLVDALIQSESVPSKTEFRRLIAAKAIEHLESATTVSSPDAMVEEGTYRIGKRRFLKILFRK